MEPAEKPIKVKQQLVYTVFSKVADIDSNSFDIEGLAAHFITPHDLKVGDKVKIFIMKVPSNDLPR